MVWDCKLCTFNNAKEDFLACEVCGCLRDGGHVQPMPLYARETACTASRTSICNAGKMFSGMCHNHYQLGPSLPCTWRVFLMLRPNCQPLSQHPWSGPPFANILLIAPYCVKLLRRVTCRHRLHTRAVWYCSALLRIGTLLRVSENTYQIKSSGRSWK